MTARHAPSSQSSSNWVARLATLVAEICACSPTRFDADDGQTLLLPAQAALTKRWTKLWINSGGHVRQSEQPLGDCFRHRFTRHKRRNSARHWQEPRQALVHYCCVLRIAPKERSGLVRATRFHERFAGFAASSALAR